MNNYPFKVIFAFFLSTLVFCTWMCIRRTSVDICLSRVVVFDSSLNFCLAVLHIYQIRIRSAIFKEWECFSNSKMWKCSLWIDAARETRTVFLVLLKKCLYERVIFLNAFLSWIFTQWFKFTVICIVVWLTRPSNAAGHQKCWGIWLWTDQHKWLVMFPSSELHLGLLHTGLFFFFFWGIYAQGEEKALTYLKRNSAKNIYIVH